MRRYYARWTSNAPDNQSLSDKDIQLTLSHRGRPPILSEEEEKLILKQFNIMEGFIKPNSQLKVISLQDIEACWTDTITSSAIREHIRRMKTACNRYGINTPLLLFHNEESGSSFKDMIGLRRLL